MRKVRLEDIFEFIRNGAQIKQFDGAGIPITRIETISNLKIDTNRLGYADIFNDDYQEYYLQNGDLLMSHINSPAHLGKTAIVEQLNKKIIHGMNLLCLRANHQVIPKYIFYYFQTQPFKNALTKIMKKSVNQASISVSDLKKIEITISSYSEQSNSVAILEQLDYQISLRQQQLQTLAQLVKSRFYELFGDPTTNSKGLSIATLTELGENLDSRRVPISSADRKSGKYPYYGASGIVDYVSDYIFDDDLLLISEDGANLISRVTPIAFSSSGKVWINNHAHVVKFKNIDMQCYVEKLLNMIDISSYITGSAQPKLNQSKLNSIPIPIPEKSIIKKYSLFVAEVDKSQLACQKSLDELETLKKSLMQAYFG